MKIGVEVGGTFTDIIAFDDMGQVRTHKVPTTPLNPEVGSLEGMRELGAEFSSMASLLHGSTIATNAVLERRGARTGLVTTRGFRDVLLIQRHDKRDSYDPFYRRPQPLVPRSLIEEVTERIGPDGEVLSDLVEEEVVSAASSLATRGVQSVAVVLLHSYANSDHEERVKQVIENTFPDLFVTISSQILPRFREYERSSTTVISAYVKPIVESYLRHFQESLADCGFDGAFLVMQANGGVVPVVGARANPAMMYLSGPAAGVVGSEYLGRQCELANLLTFDVGGTSTDISLITDGALTVTSDGEIDGLPISLPLVDIVSVGAGGGSIAWMDDGGMLRVGPASSGADPGPASYGKGGTDPTLTDALVLIGLMPPDRFLGGRMPLDVGRAEAAVSDLARQFDQDMFTMAESILRVAVANVTEATRLVSVQRGYDPRTYAICAYGGAGPLLAAFLAEELAIDHVVVPVNPGLFSAFGLLVSDFKRDYAQTRIERLSRLRVEDVQAVIDQLHERAASDFTSYGLSIEASTLRRWLDMRYEGQGYELRIPLNESALGVGTLPELKQSFDRAHFDRYGHNFPERDVVLINYGLTVTNERQVPWPYGQTRKDDPKHPAAGRIFQSGEWRECVLHLRRDLAVSDRVLGPAVISEDTATTFVPVGWNATVDELGNLHLSKRQGHNG